MVDTAAVRALRTMDLVPYILENPGLSTRELAIRFSVSQKQIESDLKLVFMCGLPGYTPYELIDLVFEDGIVSIIDPQVLNKPRNFSSSEIIVIKLGLEILKEINQFNKDKLSKIQQLSTKVNKIGSNHSIVMMNEYSASLHLPLISRAINENRIIHFQYQSLSKDETSKRMVIPYRINFLNGNLYLISLDLHLESERVFKLDLMDDCQLGDLAPDKLTIVNQDVTIVELIIDPKNRFFIERNTSIIIDQSVKSGKIHVRLGVKNLDWIKRAVLSNAPGITVISPASLVDSVNQMAADLISAYSAEK